MSQIEKMSSVWQEVRPVMKVLLAGCVERSDWSPRATPRGQTKNRTQANRCKQNISFPVPRSRAKASKTRQGLRGASSSSYLLEYRISGKSNETTIRGPERSNPVVRPGERLSDVGIEVAYPEHGMARRVHSDECQPVAVRRDTEKGRREGKHRKPSFFGRVDRESNGPYFCGSLAEVGNYNGQRCYDEGDRRQRPRHLFADFPSGCAGRWHCGLRSLLGDPFQFIRQVVCALPPLVRLFC